jgi:hypothetical protein
MSAIGGHRAVEGYSGSLCVTDRQHRNSAHGRQGKRPAFGAAYMVGTIEDFANTTDTPCWRSQQFFQRNQSPQRRRCTTYCDLGP